MGQDSVLVIGSGGREHALVSALAKSPKVKTVYVAPGNDGMQDVATPVNLDVTKHSAVFQFIFDNKIKLTVIGPEAPLVQGLSDELRSQGALVVGASQKASLLEGSKVFAKEFMTKYGIPTAPYRIFTHAADAKTFASSEEGKNFRVLKADGLAAGKGVIVASSTEELLQAITTIMEDKKFGAAGEKVVLEELLAGPEISIIALTDGTTVLPFPASQDHKRALDGDKGPNTGGMGAYAPTPFYTDHVKNFVSRDIFDNFIRGIKSEGLDFRGFIYFGLMVTADGPKVLEFNVRFGDPEAQAVLPLIESDLYDAFTAVAEGKLSKVHLEHKHGYACTVVMASGGYPDSFEKGYPITGLESVSKKRNVQILHAGTKKVNGVFVTNGGRVLNVTGLGKTLEQAVVRAYQGVKYISFEKVHFRNDIAGKAIKKSVIVAPIKRMKERHGRKI